MDLLSADALGPLVVAASAVVVTVVQRGRRETTERFDRIERTLADVATSLRNVDQRQDASDVERAVLRNEVDTIKDRHAVVDMLHRRGAHRRKHLGLWEFALWLIRPM